jgi:hypothetical protein
MVKAHDAWPCGAFLAEGHLNRRSFSAMLRQISLVPARASRCSEKTRLRAVLGVSPTKVRKVPQDSCQLPGRKGFSAIPELPNGTWFSRSVLGA